MIYTKGKAGHYMGNTDISVNTLPDANTENTTEHRAGVHCHRCQPGAVKAPVPCLTGRGTLTTGSVPAAPRQPAQ